MKLLGKQLDKAGVGRIKLLPQEPEDLWHAFNIIAVGDRVVAKTIRFVFIIKTRFSSFVFICMFTLFACFFYDIV